MKQIIPFNDNQIIWHLENNVYGLTDQTIKSILKTCHQVNKGKISLSDKVTRHDKLTIGEMLEDLQLINL